MNDQDEVEGAVTKAQVVHLSRRFSWAIISAKFYAGLNIQIGFRDENHETCHYVHRLNSNSFEAQDHGNFQVISFQICTPFRRLIIFGSIDKLSHALKSRSTHKISNLI